MMGNAYLNKVERGQLVTYLWPAGGRDVDITYGVVIHPAPRMPTVLFENQAKPVRIKIHSLFNTSSVSWPHIKRHFDESILRRYGIDTPTPATEVK